MTRERLATEPRRRAEGIESCPTMQSRRMQGANLQTILAKNDSTSREKIISFALVKWYVLGHNLRAAHHDSTEKIGVTKKN